MSTEHQSDPAKAVLRVLKTGIHRGGNVLLLSLAACAIASLLGLPLSPAVAAFGPLLEMLKGGALAKVLERVAFGHDVTDAQINAAFDEALARTNLDALLTDKDFQRALARQMSELHIIEMAVKEGDGEIIARILVESRRFDAFADEMRGEFQRLHDRLDTLATSAQAESIIALLKELLARDQTRPATALHQLPSPPGDFTGREAELAQLRAAFDPARRHVGAAISGLRGMGGVGKTALGLVIANELKAQYPDAQLFFDLRGQPDSKDPASPAEALSHVIRAFSPDARLPEDEAQLRAIYLDLLNDKRALIVMDNARDAAQVAPLIPPPSCALLVTSRQSFTLPGMRAVELGVLSRRESKALLRSIAPRICGFAGGLGKQCGDLPYALRIAGDYIANNENVRVPAYLADLQTEQGRLGLIEGTLALSYNGLTADQQLRWRELAIFPDTFDDSGAAAVWGTDFNEQSRKTAATYLGELLRFSLVIYDVATYRYRLHDLARIYLYPHLSTDEQATIARRHASHYADMLVVAQMLYDKGGENIYYALRLYDLEVVNISTGQRWASSNAANSEVVSEICLGYAGKGGVILSLRLHPKQHIGWLEAGLSSARLLKRKQSEAALLGGLGLRFAALGDYRRALNHHEKSLSLARETNDKQLESHALGNLGNVQLHLGSGRKALKLFRWQLDLALSINDRRGQANAVAGIGQVFLDNKELVKAYAHFRQAFSMYQSISDLRGAGNSVANMGNVNQAAGKIEEARALHLQALEFYRQIRDRAGEATILRAIGDGYATQGNLLRAINYFEQSLACSRQIGRLSSECATLFSMAIAEDLSGNRGRAISLMRQSFRISETINSQLHRSARKKLREWGVEP
ncbi:MAG: ATP-binding protein [Chloroflexi bacterium]|nr:ATP-binding protein [Chloroflexota bacterium]